MLRKKCKMNGTHVSRRARMREGAFVFVGSRRLLPQPPCLLTTQQRLLGVRYPEETSLWDARRRHLLQESSSPYLLDIDWRVEVWLCRIAKSMRLCVPNRSHFPCPRLLHPPGKSLSVACRCWQPAITRLRQSNHLRS